jgi:hypothetical protein
MGFGEKVLASRSNVYVPFFGHIAGGAGSAHARIDISRDKGETWLRQTDPCTEWHGNEQDTYRASAAGPWLALLCVPRTNQGPDFVELSGDGGGTFMRTRPIPTRYATNIKVSVTGVVTVGRNHKWQMESRDGGRT